MKLFYVELLNTLIGAMRLGVFCDKSRCIESPILENLIFLKGFTLIATCDFSFSNKSGEILQVACFRLLFCAFFKLYLLITLSGR